MSQVATVVVLAFRDKDGNDWRAGATMTTLRRGELELDATQATALGMELTGIKVVIDARPGEVGPVSEGAATGVPGLERTPGEDAGE